MNPSENPALPDADEQAALWAGRLAGAELDAAQRRELASWLAAAPHHRSLLLGYVTLSRDAERILPELAAAGQIAMPAPERSNRSWRGWLGAVGAAAALAVAAVWFWPAPALQWETPALAQSSHALADGSTVDLNARSALTVNFSRSERRVALVRGEALFAIAPDPDRPFLVATPAGEVRVTGTKFNVRLEADEVIEVTVLEGAVLVAAPGQAGAPLRLAVGDQLVLRGGVPDWRKLPLEDLQDAIAWLKGRVIFNETPLRDAAARFAHYHGCKIDVAPEVAAETIGGAYALNDLDAFLAGVALRNIRATRAAAGEIRLHRP